MIWIVAIIAFAAGLWIPIGAIDIGLAGLLVTFFGLLSASVLPAMSLLVANTLSPRNSVKSLNRLYDRTARLIRKLWQTLGFLVTGAIFSIVVAKTNTPLPNEILSLDVPCWAKNAPNQIIQSIVCTCFVVGLDRLRVIGSAFKSVLDERYDLAVSASQKNARDNLKEQKKIDEIFPKSERFGETVEVVAEDT
ncbi:hypothetical protein [Aliiroseovarius lamellibrachiae]|uniref:hypothetical protein n=1 Tax=Aliiroseovarius lamellibrachiae TaxID=1924933 RepID=UPI001BE06DC3|nr:hypothetical protein [Aliiroseovarius lamellibrachiae]MBT2131241.1 hypothetical protein [Aliiroseovarius lamellibrachiae]